MASVRSGEDGAWCLKQATNVITRRPVHACVQLCACVRACVSVFVVCACVRCVVRPFGVAWCVADGPCAMPTTHTRTHAHTRLSTRPRNSFGHRMRCVRTLAVLGTSTWPSVTNSHGCTPACCGSYRDCRAASRTSTSRSSPLLAVLTVPITSTLLSHAVRASATFSPRKQKWTLLSSTRRLSSPRLRLVSVLLVALHASILCLCNRSLSGSQRRSLSAARSPWSSWARRCASVCIGVRCGLSWAQRVLHLLCAFLS